ncbi:MAG: DUF6455 family protein [Paracoccaceae bacterium]
MSSCRRFDGHEDLLGRMADALGVDLDLEVQSGRLPPDEMEITVYRCVSCEEPGACRQWLAERDGQGAEAPPPYCRNRDRLEAMRRG